MGEAANSRNMFPVLSYCLIPIAVGAAAALGMQLLDLPAFPFDGMKDTDAGLSLVSHLTSPELAPSLLFQNAVTISFIAWAFVLFVKSNKDFIRVWDKQGGWRYIAGSCRHVCAYSGAQHRAGAFAVHIVAKLSS